MELEERPEEAVEVLLAQVSGRYLGKLVKSKVMVSKIGEIGAEIYAKLWKCPACNYSHEAGLNDDRVKCKECNKIMNCKGELKRDFKEIEVEEVLNNLDRQPERLRVKIIGKLLQTKKIEFIQPGDTIELKGYVEEEKVRQKLDRIILKYYILAETIEKNAVEEDESLTEDDIKQIQEIAKDKPIEKLRDSLAPNIYDYEKVKTALLLQMVRGPENMPNNRPRIHILLVGSPSSGKSKLAEAVHAKMPKSIYGSGENMSKAGLISSMEKDELSGRWGIRAGSICRANRNMLIIDELDKLNKEDRDGLHTPMEMGLVLVDKAGLHAQILADTSILGCCNPKNGKFDLSHMDSIQSQINLPEPLMTRFDLIWIIQDKIDKDRDEKIIRSLMVTNKVKPIISEKVFKKYIQYCSRLTPELTEDVEDTVVKIISELRQTYLKLPNKEGKSAITFRQAGGLIRLATAAAKLRLSPKVELCDLKLAEDLMLDALQSAGFGKDFNSFEYAALYGGTTNKKIALIDQIKNEIKNQILTGNKNEDNIKKKLLENKFPEKEVNKLFFTLRQEGTIIGRADNVSWFS
jgi:replicative DNA helicase Mcm